jgi:hypothetical protein
MMIPRELCHYTRKDTALEKILYTKKIKLSQLMFTNDPKESAGMQGGFISPINMDPEAQSIAHEVRELASRIRLEEWKVLCLSRHRTERGVRSGILEPLSKGYGRPRMWAQYAENHAGICLIFNGKYLEENIRNAFESKDGITVYHGPVTYRNYGTVIPLPPIDRSSPLRLGEDEIRCFFHQNYKEIFLVKNLDWRNETEYRWLIHSTTQSAEYVSIEGALKSVLVGMNFPDVYLPALYELCKQLRVPAGRMFWTDGIPTALLDCIYKP